MNATETLVNVNDLKQFIYCPRILYYRLVVPVTPPTTYLMERGKNVEEEFERLEPRRTLSKYDFEDAKRHFQKQLTDFDIGLTGKLDLLLEGNGKMGVVEVKATAQDVFLNQKIQLAAYAILAESSFKRPCPTAFVVLTDRKELKAVEITQEVKKLAMEILEKIKMQIQEPLLPDPTPVRKRCEHCEFKNFCSDIF